jgi:2-methylcitrate dehydratase PrpD
LDIAVTAALERTPPSLAESYGAWIEGLSYRDIPAPVRAAVQTAVIDFAGLCVAARRSDYVGRLLAAWEGAGPCSALGHDRSLDTAGAAMVNGTAAHGEDFDDTFEGTPVHTSAVVVPAVLAACERYERSGADALRGIAVGSELMCRLALVAPMAIHRAGFHPTAVIGALGATAGVGAALGLSARQIGDGLGVAGSFASGLIEYLAEGTWTKRLHAGWAAQSGLRAALLGQQGFPGPRKVIEGTHGFFHGFADHGITPNYDAVLDGLGRDWRVAAIAFKPYACGTMTQPFVDCAVALARQGVAPGDIAQIVCQVGEGTVHRLWEPLAEKQAPSTSYSAKFSVPYCVAVGFIDRAAGLEQFAEARVADPQVRALAAKVRYQVDPADDYPRNYSGRLAVTLNDGSRHEARQPHLRGGAREPLGRDEILAKFRANTAFGGWPSDKTERLEAFCLSLFEQPNLSGLKAVRA